MFLKSSSSCFGRYCKVAGGKNAITFENLFSAQKKIYKIQPRPNSFGQISAKMYRFSKSQLSVDLNEAIR